MMDQPTVTAPPPPPGLIHERARWIRVLRMAFVTLLTLEFFRLHYASTPCLHPSALPFYLMFTLGIGLSVASLRQKTFPTKFDVLLIFYGVSAAVTFYFWGSLRGSTLGALKGALGLTGIAQGALPKPSHEEIECAAAQWSLTSYIRTESRPVSLIFIGLSLWMMTWIWILPWWYQRKRAHSP